MLKPNFQQARIVITGVNGGIAKATATLLANAGAEIIVSARSEDKLETAIADIPGKVTGYLMDVTKTESVEKFFQKIGVFDHLVTPAASSLFSPIDTLDFASAKNLLETKQWGQLLCVYYGQKQIRRNGSITLFSGTVTQKPLPGASMYAAVGAATEAAARIWAHELAPLRVNTVVPGVIATQVWQQLLGDKQAAENQLSAIAESLPVKRVGTSEDIAKAVAFLIDNTFVNGSALVVDGGHRLI